MLSDPCDVKFMSTRTSGVLEVQESVRCGSAGNQSVDWGVLGNGAFDREQLLEDRSTRIALWSDSPDSDVGRIGDGPDGQAGQEGERIPRQRVFGTVEDLDVTPYGTLALSPTDNANPGEPQTAQYDSRDCVGADEVSGFSFPVDPSNLFDSFQLGVGAAPIVSAGTDGSKALSGRSLQDSQRGA